MEERTAAPALALPHAPDDRRERALDILCSDELEPIVELVAWSMGQDRFGVRAHDGCVIYGRVRDGHGWSYSIESVDGRNPLADQATGRFIGIDQLRASPYPDRRANSYPHAYDELAQIFDHRDAPDVYAVHTAAHNWEERGGNRGEHGSVDSVQSRAVFLAAGSGIRSLGEQDRSCRIIDIAPTVLALLGARPSGGVGPNGGPRADALLARQDGEIIPELIDPAASPPAHVVCVLIDGCNLDVARDLAARGEAPSLARLIATGSLFTHGAIASSPTVTLPNHTSAITGSQPAHHGILHNAWRDRATGARIVTESPATWAFAMNNLSSDVETLFAAVARSVPGARSAAINEPCDTGADFSTFAHVRAGAMPAIDSAGSGIPHANAEHTAADEGYSWCSMIDHAAVNQFVQQWSDGPPTFTWINFTLVDTAGHKGGPDSPIARAAIHDTDARLGELLATIDDSGKSGSTAIFVLSDHGMEDTNPAVKGDWQAALDAAGIPVTDEQGFLYLTA
ncbi:MAG: alkaline phosphatase family protein [Actinomycetota bacterium]|nr:alkaline phosphatase family protein [Actinomycetota bacterium]